MKRWLSLAVGAAGLTAALCSNSSAQDGDYGDPPPLARPNGYVFDPTYGWRPRASFFGGYNTGSYSASGRYGLYRRATPFSAQQQRSGLPRYGGFGPGISEQRRFGGADYWAR